MKTHIKLNALDRRNLAAGLNAVVWPYLFFSPLGFCTGILAGILCVLLVGTVLCLRDRRRYVGCELRTCLLLFLPGTLYCTAALLLNRMFA